MFGLLSNDRRRPTIGRPDRRSYTQPATIPFAPPVAAPKPAPKPIKAKAKRAIKGLSDIDIADAMLTDCGASLCSVWRDKNGNLLTASVTDPQRRGDKTKITSVTYRKALDSKPVNARSVHWFANGKATSARQSAGIDAANYHGITKTQFTDLTE